MLSTSMSFLEWMAQNWTLYLRCWMNSWRIMNPLVRILPRKTNILQILGLAFNLPNNVNIRNGTSSRVTASHENSLSFFLLTNYSQWHIFSLCLHHNGLKEMSKKYQARCICDWTQWRWKYDIMWFRTNLPCMILKMIPYLICLLLNCLIRS